MLPETNRLLLILRLWENERGLTLALEGDKIKTSRQLTDDERELILTYRQEIVALIPMMTFRTHAECQPHLAAWWEAEKRRWHK